MQFLKTLFWVLVAAVLTVFAFNNWDPVTVNLWRELKLQTFLPVLVIGAFLVGVLLIWLPHRAQRWGWKRKVDAAERKLADERIERARLEERLMDERSRAEMATERPMMTKRPVAAERPLVTERPVEVERRATAEPLVVKPGETVVVSPARDADGRPLDGPDRL